MDLSRKLGVLIFCGIPAIVGGGIAYAVFDGYTSVIAYEIILLIFAGVFFNKA